MILIGAGDATSLRPPNEAAAYLAAAVRRLRDAGVEVVVGTCPDLGATRAFAPPLRQIVGWLGRRVAQAQAAAVHAAGGDVVDLARETGPVFRADPGALCLDGSTPPPTVTGCGRTPCSGGARRRDRPPASAQLTHPRRRRMVPFTEGPRSRCERGPRVAQSATR